MSEKPIPNLKPVAYASILPFMVEAARSHGYALALHGSKLTDLDVIAVPWTADAEDAETLASAVIESVAGMTLEAHRNGQIGEKPHGRRVWTIVLYGGYVDLSVIPRAQDWTPPAEPESVALKAA